MPGEVCLHPAPVCLTVLRVAPINNISRHAELPQVNTAAPWAEEQWFSRRSRVGKRLGPYFKEKYRVAEENARGEKGKVPDLRRNDSQNDG